MFIQAAHLYDTNMLYGCTYIDETTHTAQGKVKADNLSQTIGRPRESILRVKLTGALNHFLE